MTESRKSDIMHRIYLQFLLIGFSAIPVSLHAAETPSLQVGFAQVDVSPKVGGDHVVYLAGFGHNRQATAVHDPIFARAVVLTDGKQKIALVSLDLVGFFHDNVLNVRKRLKGFDYVLVSSTHNHEGPDTLGLWGKNPFSSGVDKTYLQSVEEGAARAVTDAEKVMKPATAVLGTIRAPELLVDGRKPEVKHDELVALRFEDAESKKPTGVLVQWNCHPETLDSKNTQASADYVGYTVKHLEQKYRCPVCYLTGTVGGLMTSLKVPVRDDRGVELEDGTFEKTERYGRLVGDAAIKALEEAKPVNLTPLTVRSKEVYLPLDNKLYVLGWQLGVLERKAYLWTGDPYMTEPTPTKDSSKPVCMKTEVAWLRLGELDIAAIPGEIYPELVLDKVQTPADPGADFPDAPVEPAVYKQLKGPYRMLIGLANDEIGYIIPKRQWDEKPPFCYGLKKSQYGEINSLGPETAPLLLGAFRDLVQGK